MSVVLRLVGMCAVVATAMAQPRPIVAERASLGVPEGWSLLGASRLDLDGDGRMDLVLLARQAEAQRVLRIHRGRAEGPTYVDPPDQEVIVPEFATGWSALRIGAAKAREILFWSRRGAVRVQEGRVEILIPADFLWQIPKLNALIAWQDFVLDLNGDGLEDVLIPEPGGLRIATQRGGENPSFELSQKLQPDRTVADLALEPTTVRRQRQRSQRERFIARNAPGLGLLEAESLLTIAEAAPVAVWRDFDADGRKDIVLRSAEWLQVFRQDAAGRYGSRPDRRARLPFPVRRERDLDLAWALLVDDLDRNGSLDAVFTMKRPGGAGLGSQVIVFNQGYKDRQGRGASASDPLFGDAGWPRQVIALEGIAVGPSLSDVDGDGRPDLSLSSFAPDAVSRFGGEARGTFELNFLLFRNEDGAFSRAPTLSSRIELAADELDEIARDRPVQFFADLNGDLVHEVLVRRAARKLQVLATRRGPRGAVGLVEAPAVEIEFGFDARVLVYGSDRPGPPGCVILGEKEVLCISFR